MADKSDNEIMTAKQRRFVDAYLNEAKYNGTRAAEIAGYSNPRQSATENLAKPYIRAEVDGYFDKLKNEGLRNTNVRVQALTETVERYDAIIAANAAHARKAMDAGEQVPEAALEGFHVKTIKLSNSGKYYSEWIFDKGLANERRATIDQIAKELNSYVTKTELSGPDKGPIQIAVADDAYDALLGDIEDSIL
jgi:hypothetical protein